MTNSKLFMFLCLGAAIFFIGCKTQVEEKIVEKIVEVETKIPSKITSFDAESIYYWKQNESGVGYSKVSYEENEDGTTKTDENGKKIPINNKLMIPAGSELSEIAKVFYGFSAKGLVESLQADGTYAVNIYYDRNLVTITVNVNGVTKESTGLYNSEVDCTNFNAVVPDGYFISSSNIPGLYPSEDTNYTVTLSPLNRALSDGFIKVEKGSFKRATSSNATAYTITFTKDLYVCDHLVTQKEWEELMTYYGAVHQNGTYIPTEENGLGDNYPVYSSRWYDAIIYCNLLSITKGLEPVYYLEVTDSESGLIDKEYEPQKWLEIASSHVVKTSEGKYFWDYSSAISEENEFKCDYTRNGYRLPTAAEWDYASLGSFKDNPNWNGNRDSINNKTVFPGYDGNNYDNRYSYIYKSSGTKHNVKGKLPNSYGIYFEGFTSEWCNTWYNGREGYATSDCENPVGQAFGDTRETKRNSFSGYSGSGPNGDHAFRLVRSGS